MNFLPINIRIADATILIVGGGKVATHKAQILSRFTDQATIIAPDISDTIKQLPFHWREKEFDIPNFLAFNQLKHSFTHT